MSDFSIDPSSPPPILTQLPSSQTAFTRKYTNPSLQSALGRLPPNLRQSLINFDFTRVQRGQPPLSSAQTLAALQTALTNQPSTPPESQSFFGGAIGDLQNLVSEVPHLPFTLLHEAQDLPSAPSKLSEVLGRGDIQSVIGGLSEVPGLRMVPGVFTASQVANKGISGLTEHPLFTALDVLPYAKPAVSALAESTFSKLPSVQAARAASDLPSLNAVREQVGLPSTAEPSALRTLARSSPTLQSIRASRPVSALRTSFGTVSRDLAQMYNATVGKVLQQSNPDALPSILTEDTAPLRAALSDAREWSSSITPQRMQELTRGLELDRNTVLSDSSLTDPERAFVRQQSDHVDAMADFAVRRDWLARVDGETFTPPEARRILNSRRQVAKFESINQARKMVEEAQVGTAPTIDLTVLRSEHLTVADREQLLRGYAQAYDAAGFDATPLKAILNASRGPNWREVGHGPALDALQKIIDNPTPRPLLTQAEMLDQLTPYARTDPSVARIRDHIRRGDYVTATKTFHDTLGTRTKHVLPGSDELLDSLRRHRDTSKYLTRTSTYSDRVVTQLRKSNTALEQRIVPARFTPLIEQHVGTQLREMFTSDPEALGLIDQGFYSLLPGLDPRELNRLQSDVARTWQDMKSQGLDPTFVHRVSPSRLPSLTRPNISDTIRTPTQIRTRTLDATPYVQDAAVALTDQAMEFLSRLGQEEFTGNVLALHGTSLPDLVERYRDAATTLAERDPSLTAAAHAQSLIQRDWIKYDPQSIFPETQAKLKTFAKESDQYIPKPVADTLQQLFHDKQYKLASIFDPVMKVFRTSILPLSPRWHVGNIFGGATLLTMSTDPLVFRNFSRAVDLVRSGELHTLEGMPPSGFGSVPAEIIDWNKKASIGDKTVAAYHYKGGATLRRLWDQSAPARDKASSIIDSSYKLNGFVDDLYRSLAYIYGHDKSITKGLSAHQAEQAGVALVRKILPEWDRITPFERQVMRFVFPFYTWAQFITKHAYRYPIDHPYRTAVTSSLARREMDDFGGALPYKFMDTLFLGNPDSQGNVPALQLGAVNPFRDVANYFTLAGFTRSANPILSTVLESLGINPAQGAQDLYPEIAYDPVTGQLRPSNPSLLSSFIGNVIPQTQLLSAMLGQNEQFKQILRTNPEAAAAMLRSSVGLPSLFRTVNPAQEAFKAETQRSTLQSQVQSEALRTGDWSRAQQFPQLRAYFQQISLLMGKSPELFKGFVPTAVAPTASDALKQGIVGLNVP